MDDNMKIKKCPECDKVAERIKIVISEDAMGNKKEEHHYICINKHKFSIVVR